MNKTIKLENQYPTEIEKLMYRYLGLYVVEKDLPYDYQHIKYATIHLRKEEFPLEIEIEKELIEYENYIEFDCLSQTVNIKLSFIDTDAIILILRRMEELNFTINLKNWEDIKRATSEQMINKNCCEQEVFESHNHNCRHGDEDKLLYALMQITDTHKRLISAHELCFFDDYLESAKKEDADINIDLESCDSEPYQLVYGALMYHDVEYDTVVENIVKNKDRALINVDREPYGQLVASAYSDIQLYKDEAVTENFIPFVALMQTKCEEEEHISTTLFPYCAGLVWENLVNREFLFACRKFVKIDNLTTDNWKEHIDMNILREAYSVADLYTGEDEEDME